MKKFFHVLCAAAAVVLLVGCSGKSEDKIPGPVAFNNHDRCISAAWSFLIIPVQKLSFL